MGRHRPNFSVEMKDALLTDLKRTPLFDLHTTLGAKIVPFAGYEMPVQYADGVMKEHLWTRTNAGLFDVSHMGQISIHARSGTVQDAARALERLMPVDVIGLAQDRQRYGFFTNAQGGILDDLMFVNRGDHLLLVVNAARKADDLTHLRDNLDDCTVTPLTDRALIALQGPKAVDVLDLHQMAFMDVADHVIAGIPCTVSRSGYTGEDGFEISCPADRAAELAQHMLDHDAVRPIGLGARDSLRLEAGLCLYGHDITTTTTPVEAGLTWAIQKARRQDARKGGFPGADIILDQINTTAPRTRVGLLPQGRAPMREGTLLFETPTGDTQIGAITSGGFGPSVQAPISMGYVGTEHATTGTTIFADIRGKRLPATVTKLPFITPNYKR